MPQILLPGEDKMGISGRGRGRRQAGEARGSQEHVGVS